MTFSFNFIRIDLSKINSIEEAKKLLSDNNISESEVKPEKLFQVKELHQTLFFDPITLYLVAYIKKGEKNIAFVPEFTDFLNEVKPISFLKEDKVLTLDVILEKISKKGIKSLNKRELIFLEKSSKN